MNFDVKAIDYLKAQGVSTDICYQRLTTYIRLMPSRKREAVPCLRFGAN